MEPQPKQYITWDNVEDSVDFIAKYVSSDLDFIVAIARGGLVPGTMLSHRLGLPLKIINIQRYDGDGVLDIPTHIRYLMETKKSLVVDDINDTGQTLKIVRDSIKNPEMEIVTLFKKHGTIMWDIPAVAITNSWIVFPWEQ